MIGFCPLASGSKGNCIYLGTKQTKVLIDAGLAFKTIKERLSQIDVNIADIEAVLITHEHSDHVKGLEVLAGNLGVPILANSDTAKSLLSSFAVCPKFKIFSTGEPFEFGDLEIHPFSIQHDAVDPVAFVVKCEGYKLGFCTDLGFATTHVISQLKGCDYLYIEANHEPSMVHSSSRPASLKKRILSRQGHLSNQECASLLAEVIDHKLKHVHLAHLSGECNSPDLAKLIVEKKLQELGYELELSIAFQDQISKRIVFS